LNSTKCQAIPSGLGHMTNAPCPYCSGEAGVCEHRCPECGGHGQAFLEDYDTVRKKPIVIHLDRGCEPCNGEGYIAVPQTGRTGGAAEQGAFPQ
jgi:DnaJ-class molecular chaperone